MRCFVLRGAKLSLSANDFRENVVGPGGSDKALWTLMMILLGQGVQQALCPEHERQRWRHRSRFCRLAFGRQPRRSEEHTSELQSLMRNSYAVFCLKKKNITQLTHTTHLDKN